MVATPSDTTPDVESSPTSLFDNKTVDSFSWSNVSVTVRDRSTKQPRTILHPCNGIAKTGQVLALMGPSGSGKTTLLNALAHRSQTPFAGDFHVNGSGVTKEQLRSISSYVEQEDALIGSLTVEETIRFASKLAVPRLSSKLRRQIVASLIKSFGLSLQQNTIIGTPLRKGISGGQKRRVSVASQLVTFPKILFLDEPTSGLDSAASYEVIKFITMIAKRHNLIVIASIHQPSTTTFELFDQLMLLSQGKTCYFGPIKTLPDYLDGFAPLPERMNPAEFILDLVNVDFRRKEATSPDLDLTEKTYPELSTVFDHWEQSDNRRDLEVTIAGSEAKRSDIGMPSTQWRLDTTLVLLHRNWIKSYRDLLAYGTRILMYAGLAIMMGTVWLRLSYDQNSIQPFINALFFSGAFMSFMAVAYVPSVIEDLQNLKKEHANGLYGPLPFVLANFIIGVPWLALITILFSLITYWLSNFRDTASGFWIWVLWLFLDLLAAESLVVLLSSIFPVFVVALAATAFANGLWMSVGGFLVPLGKLNVFWKYVFHYIDYQAYVFQAMMYNQFKETVYDCETQGASYYCLYPSDLQGQGKIRGTAVLDAYHYTSADGKLWEWFGIMVAIIIVYRVLGYGVLTLRTGSL